MMCRCRSTGASASSVYIGRIADGVAGLDRGLAAEVLQEVSNGRVVKLQRRGRRRDRRGRPARRPRRPSHAARLGRRRSQREGLVDTPRRVVEAYEELFAGYAADPDAALARVSTRSRATPTSSSCATFRSSPIASTTSRRSSARRISATIPRGGAVGLSKLARVVEMFARRLQTQEAMTAQIAEAIERGLKPRGVAVMIEAEHSCMSMRGVKKAGRLDGDDRSSPAYSAPTARSSGASSTCCAPRDERAGRETTADVESGAEFAPRFAADGLITCVTIDGGRRRGADGRAHERRGAANDAGDGGRALLVALARRALAQGRHVRPECSGSSSCGSIATRMRCWRVVEVGGDGGACHTGRRSCFYRRVEWADGMPGSYRKSFLKLREGASVGNPRYKQFVQVVVET